VITNSLPVAEMLGRCSEVEVHLLADASSNVSRFSSARSRVDPPGSGNSTSFSSARRGFPWPESGPANPKWPRSEDAHRPAKRVVVCAHAAKLDRETASFFLLGHPNFNSSPMYRLVSGHFVLARIDSRPDEHYCQKILNL